MRLSALNGRFVRLNGLRESVGVRDHLFDLFLRSHFLVEEFLVADCLCAGVLFLRRVARQIRLRLAGQRDIFRQVGFELRQLRRQGPGIDREEAVVLLDEVTFFKEDLG